MMTTMISDLFYHSLFILGVFGLVAGLMLLFRDLREIFRIYKHTKKFGFDRQTVSKYVESTKEFVTLYEYQRDKEYQTIVNWVKAPPFPMLSTI